MLLTADDVVRRAHYRNAQRTLDRLLAMGAVPVVNENDTVATDEIRFGDNDRLAALVAHLVHADLLVLLSDVDGLYDGDPRRPALGLIPDVRSAADLAGCPVGRPARAASAPAAWPPRWRPPGSPPPPGSRRSSPSVVLGRAACSPASRSAPCSTRSGAGSPTRLLWLAHAAPRAGTCTSTPARCGPSSSAAMSLLPAGVTAVTGTFVAGDPVDLLDENGHAVARGLVNFDATELPGLLGRSTRELARELGPAYEREVVHRDDLVLLRR